MIQLNVTVGLPGCGKTTRARRWVADAPGRTRVNRDDLREMMFGGWTGDQAHEDAVTAAQLAAVRALLAAGVSVVVDDTNIRPEHIERLCRIGWDLDATVGIWDMTSVPVDDCVRRDEARGLRGERCVGEAVIRGMHALRLLLTVCVGCSGEVDWGMPAYASDAAATGRLCTGCATTAGLTGRLTTRCERCPGRPMVAVVTLAAHDRLVHPVEEGLQSPGRAGEACG
jgi:predicted kinase